MRDRRPSANRRDDIVGLAARGIFAVLAAKKSVDQLCT